MCLHGTEIAWAQHCYLLQTRLIKLTPVATLSLMLQSDVAAQCERYMQLATCSTTPLITLYEWKETRPTWSQPADLGLHECLHIWAYENIAYRDILRRQEQQVSLRGENIGLLYFQVEVCHTLWINRCWHAHPPLLSWANIKRVFLHWNQTL